MIYRPCEREEPRATVSRPAPLLAGRRQQQQGRYSMKTAVRGVIHGKVIELEEESGLPDGQEVSVTLEPFSPATSPTSPEARAALRRAAGAWADDTEELDRYLQWNRQQRKGSRTEIPQ